MNNTIAHDGCETLEMDELNNSNNSRRPLNPPSPRELIQHLNLRALTRKKKWIVAASVTALIFMLSLILIVSVAAGSKGHSGLTKDSKLGAADGRTPLNMVKVSDIHIQTGNPQILAADLDSGGFVRIYGQKFNGKIHKADFWQIQRPAQNDSNFAVWFEADETWYPLRLFKTAYSNQKDTSISLSLTDANLEVMVSLGNDAAEGIRNRTIRTKIKSDYTSLSLSSILIPAQEQKAPTQTSPIDCGKILPIRVKTCNYESQTVTSRVTATIEFDSGGPSLAAPVYYIPRMQRLTGCLTKYSEEPNYYVPLPELRYRHSKSDECTSASSAISSICRQIMSTPPIDELRFCTTIAEAIRDTQYMLADLVYKSTFITCSESLNSVRFACKSLGISGDTQQDNRRFCFAKDGRLKMPKQLLPGDQILNVTVHLDYGGGQLVTTSTGPLEFDPISRQIRNLLIINQTGHPHLESLSVRTRQSITEILTPRGRKYCAGNEFRLRHGCTGTITWRFYSSFDCAWNCYDRCQCQNTTVMATGWCNASPYTGKTANSYKHILEPSQQSLYDGVRWNSYKWEWAIDKAGFCSRDQAKKALYWSDCTPYYAYIELIGRNSVHGELIRKEPQCNRKKLGGFC